MLRKLHRADGSVRDIHLGGWKKQTHDSRDEAFRLKLPQGFLGALPVQADLRDICSKIEDQGDLGSCTANGFSALVESNEIRGGATKLSAIVAALASVTVSNIVTQNDGSTTFSVSVVPPAPTPTPTPPPAPPAKKLIEVSRLFEYYATRKIERTVSEDSGASIRDTIKAAAKYGVVSESLWPYNIAKFAVNPPDSVWNEAIGHKVTSYHSIADGDGATFRSTLVSGYLIEFGFNVFDYMLSSDMAKKGYLPLPADSESVQGGHAVCLVGYNDQYKTPSGKITKAYLIRNSWGTSWGLSGYYWMDAAYVENQSLSSDFWVVQSSPV
jgi:C1A family cysteine protease